jgi:hypothetical protein
MFLHYLGQYSTLKTIPKYEKLIQGDKRLKSTLNMEHSLDLFVCFIYACHVVNNCLLSLCLPCSH